MDSNAINLTVIYEDESFELQATEGEYRSLMTLLYDKIYIEDFGECLGMGRCGTCTITIEKSTHQLTSFGRNEQATLGKMALDNKALRLSCQIAVDKNLDGAVIRIVPAYEIE